MPTRPNPVLYQLNTRVYLTALSGVIGRAATLDDIPEAELERLQNLGFEWVWMLSVWQTGEAGQRISRANESWRKEFKETLPDLREEDIAGSGFAVTAYTVSEQLGGDAALARLRKRMAARDLKLMLDFVPNHVSPDHPWTNQYPDFFVQGSEEDLKNNPANYTRIQTEIGENIFAYGRDPYFPGWPDTLQLNYANWELQEAMTRELIHVSDHCDGVRCDMAMLICPDVFERTWGNKPGPFWPRALLRVKDHHPGFITMAEVYWDMEWELQQQGFDFTYDKRLYDRLREGKARSIRDHFGAAMDYQEKLVRFLENHDESRAAATFPAEEHEAAALVAFLSPGLRFFHQGQLEGNKKHIPTHLVRGPREEPDQMLADFYEKLLETLKLPAFHIGRWTLLECAPAWGGNESNDHFVAFNWQDARQKHYIVAVNYSGEHAQCFVKLPLADLENKQWRLRDLFSDTVFDREGNDLAARGLFLDEKAWKYYVFELVPKRTN